MQRPCIICVAITGSLPRKDMNPAVPISITEQIESTQEAFEAGATICHAHVRTDDESPSRDPDKFALLKKVCKSIARYDYSILNRWEIRQERAACCRLARKWPP